MIVLKYEAPASYGFVNQKGGCDCVIVMMKNYKQGHPINIGICSWQVSIALATIHAIFLLQS